MVLAIVVLVVVAVVIGVVLLRRRARRRRESDSRPAPEAGQMRSGQEPGPVPPFKVVALGLSGSGKTVLLSSMFHRLDHVATGRTFYLETTPEQRIALNEVYRTVSDTRREWPRGTRLSELTEYVFNCIALDDDGARHHVLDVVYIDYAGELLERAQDTGQGSFHELVGHIGSAQALLGLLDGHRILQLLRGEAAGYDYVEFELRTLLGMLQSARAPIQLVISKWDLVRDFGESPDADDEQRLDRVIRALMAFDHFRGLVYSGPAQLVRLIPVSAVGRGFADLRGDGAVVKRSDGTVRPMNVEVPLCAVVPDLFRQVERSIDDVARREIDESLRRSMKFRPADMLSGFASFFNRGPGGVLRTVLLDVMGGVIANEVGRMFVEWAARPYERISQDAASARALREEEFGRFTAARERVLGQFETVVRRLEAAMPNSELSRR
jgi:hypothetical protein